MINLETITGDTEEINALKKYIRGISNTVISDLSAVLIQPPQLQVEKIDIKAATNKGYFAYPPQGLLYLSAILNDLDVQTDIADLNYYILQQAQENIRLEEIKYLEKIDEIIRLRNPSIICLSFMFDSTFEDLRRIVSHIKRNYPDKLVLIGWVAATANPVLLLEDWLADIVFSHEAETSIKKFINFILWKTDSFPPNISFKYNGVIYHTTQILWWDHSGDIRQ